MVQIIKLKKQMCIRDRDTVYDCTFNLYLSEKDDFHNRQKYDFPIVAISLSDYNTICLLYTSGGALVPYHERPVDGRP